jgi:hypothetical protein
VTDLAAYLGLEKSTMSGLIDRAEKRGILSRLPSETDGRAVDVTLTPAGRALADRIHARVRAGLSPMTGGLTAAERAHLRGLLEKILTPNGSSRLPEPPRGRTPYPPMRDEPLRTLEGRHRHAVHGGLVGAVAVRRQPGEP